LALSLYKRYRGCLYTHHGTVYRPTSVGNEICTSGKLPDFLQSSVNRHFQHLRNQTEHDYDKIKVYYSADHRLDIKLYAIDQTQPNLMLTFEDGCPYEEDDEAPEPILRPGETLVISYTIAN
jgi:hypothetical protein